MTLVNVPFYSTDLPAPLPTTDEIHAATDITEIYGGRRVVSLGHHSIVKFSESVNLMEGQNMIFVRQRTSVLVPQVFALFSEAGKSYIVMERIHGKTLLSQWTALSPTDKECIVLQLKTYIDELRALSPPDYYGSLDGEALLDGVFWTSEPQPTINGPFASEKELNEALALKYTYDGRSSFRADFYRQCLPRIFTGHRPSFTHGDFQRKNILMQQSEDTRGACLYLIDWEASGWYPSYWEYGLAVWALKWDDDWCLWIDKALDSYVPEAAWLQALRLELWS